MRFNLHIPHLDFTVCIRPRPKEWKSYASTMFSDDGYSVELILPDNCTASGIAHELIHVLQEICRRYNINFKEEDEHLAYIMQWLFEEIQAAQKRARKHGRKKNGRHRRSKKL